MFDPLEFKCDPKELENKLTPYKGGMMQLWHYTVSHSMMTFRVYKGGMPDKYLTLSFVERIEGETMWKIEKPVVAEINERMSELRDGKIRVNFEECLFSDEQFKIA